MHYITFLYETTREEWLSSADSIELRGYNPCTWASSEFSDLQLPVNALAYNICPTSRDIYLDRVINQETEQTWERYKGRVIDKIYKLIHKECKEYASTSTASDFDLYNYLTGKSDTILDVAKDRYKDVLKKIPQLPAGPDVTRFDEALKKIVLFEALVTAARMNFELARMQAANPEHIFQEYFEFNTDFKLAARHQGFTPPATPDFIYRHKVMGDIKSGKWHQFMEYTVVAYALAFEEHTGDDMDFGVILHVDLPQSRLVPAHYHTDLIFLDDKKREKFFALRDRKLQIVADESDPGTPATKDECNPECPFLSSCWDA